MTIIGTFIESNNGFTGTIRTTTLDVRVKFVPNDKSSDNAPDYRLLTSGNYEIGAAWKKISPAEKRPYLSVALDDPSLPSTVYARLIEGENSAYTLIWSRSKGEQSPRRPASRWGADSVGWPTVIGVLPAAGHRSVADRPLSPLC